ncbi:M20 metallopeptidase family protein [Pseudonocardia sp. GCM10023141]|uniref:M20 metallopeptidase family protein n=1 Tax=Pseudonocardia sp. GCM10023141 TaxID=3252653 RepID=UPI003610E064
MTSGIVDDAGSLHPELVQLRRRLHAEPELGLQLPRTQEKVLHALDGLPLEIATGTGLTSVTAVLRGGRPGATVLLRGDMDALPLAERSGLDYASQTGDTMHACGHDLHTSMLVGAAQLLAARREQLAGQVVFMFQPGEEGFDGAAAMLAEGVLDAAGPRVDHAYGLHVMSAGMPPGVFVTRRGPILAAADTVRVVVRGAGGHGSMPHRAKDPIAAAAEMVTALQTYVTRRFDVFDPVVVTVGTFHAGTQFNIIPDEAVFEATVRSFSRESHAAVRDGFVQVCQGVGAAHGVAVDVEYTDLYPVTVNDAAEAEFAVDVVTEVLGEQRVAWAANPIPASEDFSRVLDEVPGAFLALGAVPADLDWGRAANNHSPLALFDDAVLGDGAAVLAELASHKLAALASRCAG